MGSPCVLQNLKIPPFSMRFQGKYPPFCAKTRRILAKKHTLFQENKETGQQHFHMHLFNKSHSYRTAQKRFNLYISDLNLLISFVGLFRQPCHVFSVGENTPLFKDFTELVGKRIPFFMKTQTRGCPLQTPPFSVVLLTHMRTQFIPNWRGRV